MSKIALFAQVDSKTNRKKIKYKVIEEAIALKDLAKDAHNDIDRKVESLVSIINLFWA